MKKLLISLLIGVFFAIVIFDFLSLITHKAEFIGVFFWLVSQLILCAYALFALSWLVNEAIHKRYRLLLLVSLAYILSIVFYAANPISLQHETTQQIGCMMEGFKQGDWLFRKNCFIGYPARQYLLPALPSIMFGRSFLALQMGGLLYFFVGILIFTKGVAINLQRWKAPSVIGALLVSALPFFYFVNQRLFYAEQSSYPFAYALILCGLFSIYLAKRHWVELLILSIAILHTVYIYTPGLALLALATLGSIYLLFQSEVKKEQKFWCVLVVTVFIVHFMYSLQYRGDIRIIPDKVSQSQIGTDLIRSFGNLVYPFGNQAFVSPIFAGTFAVLLGIETWTLSLWIIGTMVIGVITRGYYFNSIDFRIQRWIVVVPVYLSLLLVYLVSLSHYRYFKLALYVLLVFFLATGYWYQSNQFSSMKRSEPNALTFWLWKKIPISERNDIYTIIIDRSFQESLGSMGDASKYFFPLARVLVIDASCNAPMPIFHGTILIVPDEPHRNCHLQGSRLRFLYKDVSNLRQPQAQIYIY